MPTLRRSASFLSSLNFVFLYSLQSQNSCVTQLSSSFFSTWPETRSSAYNNSYKTPLPSLESTSKIIANKNDENTDPWWTPRPTSKNSSDLQLHFSLRWTSLLLEPSPWAHSSSSVLIQRLGWDNPTLGT